MKGCSTPQLRYGNIIKYLEIKDLSYTTLVPANCLAKQNRKTKASLAKKKKNCHL